VTTAQLIAHWRKGAKDALHLAKRAAADGLYELALFHCHLAVEKALKAAIMEKTGEPHAKVHALAHFASTLRTEWSPDDRELLDTLSDVAVAARKDKTA
jgi:HEPN domain-containing protein